MTVQPRIAVAALVALTLAVLPVSAQKKPQPPADIPGAAWIDNDAVTPCAADPSTRIHSDCQGANGRYSADAAGTYAKLNSERAFWLNTYGNRFVTLDFTDLVPGSVLCGTQCYRQFPNVFDTTVPKNTSTPWTFSLHGNVVDANGTPLPNGFMSLNVGASNAARLFVNIPDPAGRNFHWTLYFNTATYATTDYVTVTRTGTCAWLIESTGQGKLVANGVGKGGRQASSEEGVFVMPFRITFEAPTCS